MLAIFLKKISDILKKNFVYLRLDKKETKKLQADFNRFIKVVSFTICFCYSIFLIFTKFGLLNLKSK